MILLYIFINKVISTYNFNLYFSHPFATHLPKQPTREEAVKSI